MKRHISVLSLLVIAMLVLAACPAPAPAGGSQPQAAAGSSGAESKAAPKASDLTFTTVVKIAGINWFNRMEEGVKKFGQETGVKAALVGPEKADAALQIPMLEDLIAKKVNALCVIPMDPDVLDPTLKKAMDAGITVITHEASNQKSMDFDIEAFDNTAYGAHLMDHLAKLMGEEGEYAVFVGSLGSKTHNEWVDGAIARQKEKYPKMKLVGDKNETHDDSKEAYEKTKELLKKYPNLKGFEGSASTDVAGIGQAIEEAGLADKTSVVGTSLPSIAGDLLSNGAVDLISFWDPMLAGEACNQIALMKINGEKVGEGANLKLTGYESLKAKGNVLYGQAWVDVTKDNAKDYNF